MSLVLLEATSTQLLQVIFNKLWLPYQILNHIFLFHRTLVRLSTQPESYFTIFSKKKYDAKLKPIVIIRGVKVSEKENCCTIEGFANVEFPMNLRTSLD